MQNPKNNSKTSILLAILCTALLVGGFSYYMFNREVQDLAKQVQSLQSLAQGTSKTAENCYKSYKEEKVSFSYPCDWKTNVTNENSLAATGTVVAPDGKASFHYPAPELGLEGMELTNQTKVRINTKDYSAKTYEGSGQTYVFIEMGTDLNEYNYNLMLAYENSDHKAELDHILETFEF